MSQATDAAPSGVLIDAQTQTQRRESLSPVILDQSSLLGTSPKYHTPTSPCSNTNRSSSTLSESTCTSPDSSQHHSPFIVSAQSPAISIPRLSSAIPATTALPSATSDLQPPGVPGVSSPSQAPGLFNSLSTLASACSFSNGSTQTPFGTINFPAPSATTSSLAISSFSSASPSLVAASTSSNDVTMSVSPDSEAAAAVLNSFSQTGLPLAFTPKASAGLTVSVPANPFPPHHRSPANAMNSNIQADGAIQPSQSFGPTAVAGVVIPSPNRVDIASEPALPYVAHSLKRYKAPATSADDCKGALLLSFIRFQAKSSPNGELDPPDPEIMRRIDMLAESMTKEEAAIPTPKRACVSPSASSLASPGFAASSSSPFQPAAKSIAHSQSAQTFVPRSAFDWDVPPHRSQTNSPVPVTPLTPSHLNFHNLSMQDPSRYSPLIAHAGHEPIPTTVLPSLASPSTPPTALHHSLSSQSMYSTARTALSFSYSSSFLGHGHATRPNWPGGFPSPTTVNAARVAQFLSNVDEKAGEGNSDIDEEAMSSSHNATDDDEFGSGDSTDRSPDRNFIDRGDVEMTSAVPNQPLPLPLPVGRTRLHRAQSFDPALLHNPGSPARVAVPRSRSPVLGRAHSPIPLPPPEELPPDFQDTFSTLQALAALSSRPVLKQGHGQHSEPHSPTSPWSAFDHHSPQMGASGFADHSRKSRSPNSTSLASQKTRRKAKAASMTLFPRARSSSVEEPTAAQPQTMPVQKGAMPVFPSLNLHILRKGPSLSSVNSFGTASTSSGTTPPAASPNLPGPQTFTVITHTSATQIPKSLTIPNSNLPPKLVSPSPTSSTGEAALTPSGRPQRLRRRPSKLDDTADKGDTA